MTHVAGLDIGASTVRAGVAVADGSLLDSHQEEFAPTDPGDATATVTGVLLEAIAQAGVDEDVIEAVGIGSMGPLDRSAGALIDPPNVPDIDRLRLVEPVAAALDCPVTLYNDAVAGVIGERYYGDGQRQHICYVTISTGIGVGAIVDGTVLHGERGNAGELGHLTLEPDSSRQCGCGGTGHWEALCSGGNLGATTRELAAVADCGTTLDLSAVDAPTLFAAAGSDPLADYVLDRVGAWNARGIAAVTQSYDPSTIHIGGGVAINNRDRIIGDIRRRLPDHVVGTVPAVEPATKGRDAVLCGAIAGVLDER